MKERTKEFADAVGAVYPTLFLGRHDGVLFTETELETFVELIAAAEREALRQAAQQALKALEDLQGGCTDSDDGTVEALTVWCPEVITALRKALEQPEQEPTPWRDMVVVSLVREGIDKHKARELADHFAAQPEQEPVAFYHPSNGFYWAKPTHISAPTVVDVEPLPLYAAAERNNG